MGVNNNQQQPAAPMTPQQQAQVGAINRLRTVATTPYSGSAPHGAASQGVAQLVAALLARKRAQALQQGNPNATLPLPQNSTPQNTPRNLPQAGPTPLPSATPAPSPGPMPLTQPLGQSMGTGPVQPQQVSLNLPPSAFGAQGGSGLFG